MVKLFFKKELLVFILSISLITNCSYFKKKDKSGSNETSSLELSKDWGKEENRSGNILKSRAGLTQITLLEGWKEQKGLNAKADIQASDLVSNNFIIVLSESKMDFNHMTLEKHSEATRSILLRAITHPKIEGPTKLMINGNSAIQYKITGSIDNLNPVYLHTTVETPKNFHQILAWTLVSKFEKNKGDLQKVIESFKEVEK